MPLNDECSSPSSVSAEDPSSRNDGSPGRSHSLTSASDTDCSRESFTSDSSSKTSSPSSSPPKHITLDDMMSSGKDLSNLTLAHEIIVNRDFHVEPPKLAQNSLEKLVRDTVHRAYWDVLASELDAQPPVYGHAIKLLEEIKEILLSFLNPGANRMRTQISEVLDMELIGQQAASDTVDIQGLASYIISTMGKLCAPVRDEEVKGLQEARGNVVTLFKEMFRVLDLMKMDVVNFTIQGLRPELQRQSVEYERAKFQSILEKTPSALDHTTSWIRGALEELLGVMSPPGQSSGPGKGQRALPGPFLVMDTAFLRILSWDPATLFPETLMTDEGRLLAIQKELHQLEVVAQVLLIVYSAMGGAIQGLPSLAERLKRMTCVLLEGMHSPDFALEEALRGVSAQLCVELSRSLTERGYPALSPALQATLTGQVLSVVQEGNPIRSLVEERVRQYFLSLLSAPAPRSCLATVPAGLTPVRPELASLAGRFMALVDFNRRVYGPFYSRVLKKLMFDDVPPQPPSAAPPTVAAPTKETPSQTAASPS
ncbi:T-complex protein 11-like protein 2 [Gadus macrocephalus]|uniref:T-complex protein 11-like protein 2 n=1 Tax=Gadus macrocephalus TaxID=80720 RepID=UPI0028CB1A27|nr:T-complex protein 11-like protein 2 [Gadus macrocephalus]